MISILAWSLNEAMLYQHFRNSSQNCPHILCFVVLFSISTENLDCSSEVVQSTITYSNQRQQPLNGAIPTNCLVSSSNKVRMRWREIFRKCTSNHGAHWPALSLALPKRPDNITSLPVMVGNSVDSLLSSFWMSSDLDRIYDCSHSGAV